MDLGFGQNNQAVGDAAAKAILQASKVQEQALQNEMGRYDAMLEDNDALEALRKRRIAEMKKQQDDLKQWKALGHGSYLELVSGQDSRDVAKEFFEISKTSSRLVVHFYRPSSAHLCDIFHKHLEQLARRHVETKFVKLSVEGCDKSGGGAGASYLVEKLGIHVMPTLLIVKNRQVVHHIRGFDELGNTDDFSAEQLARVLAKYGALNLTAEEHEEEECERSAHSTIRRNGAASVNCIQIKGAGSRTRYAEDHDDI